MRNWTERNENDARSAIIIITINARRNESIRRSDTTVTTMTAAVLRKVVTRKNENDGDGMTTLRAMMTPRVERNENDGTRIVKRVKNLRKEKRTLQRMTIIYPLLESTGYSRHRIIIKWNELSTFGWKK
jgi:hypothetical protein